MLNDWFLYFLIYVKSEKFCVTYLAIAECDGEPAEVPVDDLNAVVSGTGDVEHAGVAGDHLLVLTLSTRIMNNNI